jgi:hypothetical protein
MRGMVHALGVSPFFGVGAAEAMSDWDGEMT